MQQYNSVRDRLGAVQVVRDHDGRNVAFFLQFEDQLVDFAGSDGIETRGGFVEQLDAGLERQRARQSHALLHTARKFGGHFVQFIFHAHAGE